MLEGLKGIGLSRRHRFGSLRRHGTGVPKQPGKRGAANTVCDENSKSERGQRRANQHQRIHCVLHILNSLPICAGGLSSPGVGCADSTVILADSSDAIPDRKWLTLPTFLLPNKIRKGLASRILDGMSRFATGTTVLFAIPADIALFSMYSLPLPCYGHNPNHRARRPPAQSARH